MRRSLACLLAAAALLAGPVQAAEPKAAASLEHVVDISTVALPVLWRERVVNYIFVDVRLNLSPRADAVRLREKEPFLRDALVRIGRQAPPARPWDFTHLDAAALTRALRPAADRIAGPGTVASIEVVKQTPRQVSGLPQPPGRTAAGG